MKTFRLYTGSDGRSHIEPVVTATILLAEQ
jgi:hypothetical protein